MEQVIDVKLKPCSICGKGIEEPKFRIHEATCARNNYKCPQCHEIVAKSEKEHHDAENHQLVKCEYCQIFESEKKGLQEHLSICSSRPQQCLYCDISLGGDKYETHLAYCGSKTTRCSECKQNIQNKDLVEHQTSQQCSFYKEIESQKAQRELLKFQEEEQKRVAAKMVDKSRDERIRKEQYYQAQQQNVKPPATQQIKPQSAMNQNNEQSSGASQNQNQNDLDYDENAEIIAKLLQEEMDAEEAKNLVNQEKKQGQPNYEDSWGEPSQNVRPPAEIYEDQMIGGPNSLGPANYSNTVQFPGGFSHVSYQSYQNMSGGPSSVPQRNYHYEYSNQPNQYNQNYEEDSYMHNEQEEHLNEDEQFRRALAESMGQNAGVHGNQNNIDDTEDEILRQIMEQSKNDK